MGRFKFPCSNIYQMFAHNKSISIIVKIIKNFIPSQNLSYWCTAQSRTSFCDSSSNSRCSTESICQIIAWHYQRSWLLSGQRTWFRYLDTKSNELHTGMENFLKQRKKKCMCRGCMKTLTSIRTQLLHLTCYQYCFIKGKVDTVILVVTAERSHSVYH